MIYPHKTIPDRKNLNVNCRTRGNIFFALFGAIALVGIIGAALMVFLKGPLATSVRITRQNTAETQMAIGAQVAVMTASSASNSGDCDSDGYVEPLEWRDAGAVIHPTGGGLIPNSIGVSKKDPWGTEYGYCAWDYGTTGACDDETGAGDNPAERLAGPPSGTSYPVVAIISAGPDKAFTTTCRSFATADVNSDGDLLDPTDLPMVSKAAETDDDVIFTYTYEEATGASGGLWQIKSGDPATAVISKNIETTGAANLKGGVLLPDSSLIDCNDVANAGIMARNAGGTGIEICDGAGNWTAISGGGGGASDSFTDDNSVACDGTVMGQVRYNTTSHQPEFCNGTQWLPFTISTPGANLMLTPTQQNGMNVNGSSNVNPGIAGVCDDNIYFCGSPIVFTLVNSGTLQSAVISLSVTNSTNFYIKAQTCTVAGGNADGKLDPNESCTITVIPKANGNYSYTGNLQVTGSNNPFSIMSGTSTNFGCFPGRSAGGGKYAACGLSDPEGQGSYDLIVMPGGCTTASTNEPTCAGGNDTLTFAYGTADAYVTAAGQELTAYMNSSTFGAKNHVNYVAFASKNGLPGISLTAINYCENMTYNAYTDWSLPSFTELQSIYAEKANIGGIVSNVYWSSSYQGNTSSRHTNYYLNMSNNSSGSDYWINTKYLRCVRRHNINMPSATVDTNPDDVTLVPQTSFSSGGAATSNTVTVTGILQSIPVSITGGTGMNIIKNGASTGSTSITGVVNNDTLAFTMNAPAVVGTQSTATVTIGDDVYSWWIGYADSSKTIKAFVTSTTPTCQSMGGLLGADTICNNLAAASSYGLSSSWKALLSDSITSANKRIPWNWKNMVLVDGTVVVDGGLSDLFDGSVDNLFNKTESGGTYNGSVWTGSDSAGGTYGTTTQTCNNYNGLAGLVRVGNNVLPNSTWISNSTVDSAWTTAAMYCIEDTTSTSDTTPASISPPYNTQVATSSRQNSSTVNISGMSSGVTASLTVTATGGTPTFTVNGGAEVTSANVTNGDAIVFYMTAPASANSSNKMTIKANGATVGYWRVWTGWNGVGSGIKRVFVDTTTNTDGTNQPGVIGLDADCTSRATSAGLGGTWVAIASGFDEANWAVNRIGYNWNVLQRVDGTEVTVAGNLWSTGSSTTALEVSISKKANGTTYSTTAVKTNTTQFGKSLAVTSAADEACRDWSYGGSTFISVPYPYIYNGSSGAVGTTWINNSTYALPAGNGQPCYGAAIDIYCIEQ